jgi:hypothetical protein
MKQLESIKQFFAQLEERTFYQYVGVFVAGLAMVMAFTVFLQYRATANLTKQAKKLNLLREESQEILSHYQQVREQEEAVTALLEKDKNFKIVNYLDTVLAALSIIQNKTNQTLSEEPLEHPANYTEITLHVSLTNLTTRQLAELLHEIEKNERIYTKDLEVTKSPTQPVIDVSISLATLQPRTEGITV